MRNLNRYFLTFIYSVITVGLVACSNGGGTADSGSPVPVPSQPSVPVPDQAYVEAQIQGQWQGYLNIVNPTQFQNMLRQTRMICDLYNVANWGASSCKSWSTGHINVSLANGNFRQNGVELTLSAWNKATGWISLPSQHATVSDYNNSAGMQIVSGETNNGYYSSFGSLAIRAVVETGRFTNDVLSMKIYYQGTLFATAEVSRY